MAPYIIVKTTRGYQFCVPHSIPAYRNLVMYEHAETFSTAAQIKAYLEKWAEENLVHAR